MGATSLVVNYPAGTYYLGTYTYCASGFGGILAYGGGAFDIFPSGGGPGGYNWYISTNGQTGDLRINCF
jgi:hypothetical protein